MDRYAPSSTSLEKIEGVLPTLSLKLDKEKKQGLEKSIYWQVGACKSWIISDYFGKWGITMFSERAE